MQLFVRFLHGESEIFDVDENETVKKLKESIKFKTGRDVKLLFAGKLLEDHKTLREYNVGAITSLVALVKEANDTDSERQNLKAEPNVLKTAVPVKPTSSPDVKTEKEEKELLWIVENKTPVSSHTKMPDTLTFYKELHGAIEASSAIRRKNYLGGFTCHLKSSTNLPSEASLRKENVELPTLIQYQANNGTVYFMYTLDKNDETRLIPLSNETNQALEKCQLNFSSGTPLEVSETKNPGVFKWISPHHHYSPKILIKAVELTKTENTKALRESDKAILYSTRNLEDWNEPEPLTYKLKGWFEQGNIALQPVKGVDENDPCRLQIYNQIGDYIKLMPPADYFQENAFDPNQPASAKTVEFTHEYGNQIRYMGFRKNSSLAICTFRGKNLAGAFNRAYLSGDFREATILDAIFLNKPSDETLYLEFTIIFSKESFSFTKEEELFIGKLQKLLNKYNLEPEVHLVSKDPNRVLNFVRCNDDKKVISDDIAKEFVKEFIQLLDELKKTNTLINQASNQKNDKQPEAPTLEQQKINITQKLLHTVSCNTLDEQRMLNDLIEKIESAKTVEAVQQALKYESLPDKVKQLAGTLIVTPPKHFTQSPTVTTQFSPSSSASSASLQQEANQQTATKFGNYF